MTGYGAGEAPVGRGRLLVELRSVNHRYLDVRVRMPPELAEHAVEVERVARDRLARGRVEIGARLEGVRGGLELDVDRAGSAFEQLGRLRDELRPDEPLPLSLLSIIPDLFTVSRGPGREDVDGAARRATEAACDALETMREREGGALAEDLAARLSAVDGIVEEIADTVTDLAESYRRKLHDRLAVLLRDTDVELDPGRLEHEVALFADRADTSEEITRLRSHCDQLRRMIETAEGPVGRRLDFLLQEMNRETNTIGAKSPDAAASQRVVELKAELERMREQVQNVL